MLTSDFSKKILDTFIHREDCHRYNVLKETHLRHHYLSMLEKKISEGTFDFSKFRKTEIGKFSILRSTKLGDELVLRKLNENIRRVYKLKQADRNSVVRQTQVLLTEAVQKHVVKLDITAFYESINREAILKKIDQDGLLSQKSVKLLYQFSKRVSEYFSSGVPRGIGLSATLAELSFRPIDEAVRRFPGVYYYARYVDDIIVFSTDESDKIMNHVASILPEGMQLNEAKCKPFYVGCNCSKICIHKNASCPCIKQCKCASKKPDFHLDYLGYALSFENIPKGKDPLSVGVQMSENKIARTKTRIVKAILDHVKKNDFSLLRLRLQFLT